MNRCTFFLCFPFLILSMLGCNGADRTTEREAEGTQQDESTRQKSQASAKTGGSSNALPTIPNALMQALVDSADYVDYLFYEMDFSMSMDNKQGVMYAIAKIGEAPAALNASCKPIGRIFYQIKGRNAAEADLYFSKGCTYLVFMENNKPVYANSMSEVGKTFLNNQFAAIMKDYVPIE